MMPKIGDIINDWQLVERGRTTGTYYRYLWRCMACGEYTERKYGTVPRHQCHRRFAPQNAIQKACVDAWYQSGFKALRASQACKMPLKAFAQVLLDAEVEPWPSVSPDVRNEQDSPDDLQED